jgi:predicted 3-demethylubiquinone-9 3-methyltransferase (glyoxalase superfamily)
MQKITNCLWFDGQAEDAVRFYTSIFKNSKTFETARYTEAGPGQPGSVMTIRFQIEDQEFLALNGGPEFKFNEAVSFIVNCKDQSEVDYYWNKLTADGGEEVQCGWLKDKYGISWQITPTILHELIRDPRVANNVIKAMLKMVKLDIAALKSAAGQ